jgi:hypothetical protein
MRDRCSESMLEKVVTPQLSSGPLACTGEIMRKYFHAMPLFLASLVVLDSNTACGQLVRSWGVKAGVSYTNMINTENGITNSQHFQWKWGSDFGLSIEMLDVPLFSVLIETHVVRKGFNPQGQEFFGSSDLDYLSIYAMPKFRASTGPIELFAFAGPRLDFIVSRNGRLYAPLINDLPPIDWGATLGLGALVKLPIIQSFGIEGRFSPSFRTMSHDYSAPNHPYFVEVKNQSFEIVGTIMF